MRPPAAKSSSRRTPPPQKGTSAKSTIRPPSAHQEGTAPGLEGCCPFQQAIDLLSKKHAMTLVWLLQDGKPRRFNDIKRALAVNPVSLSQRLSELEAAGVLERKTYREIPPRVEYWLTQKGRDLVPLMDQLGEWSNKHEQPVAA